MSLCSCSCQYCRVNGCQLAMTYLQASIPENTPFHVEQSQSIGKAPHKCPVCNGIGKKVQPLTYGIPFNFHEVCPACEGKCVIWG